MQSPVRAQPVVGPLQHSAHRPVRQRPRLAPQRLPDRLVDWRQTSLVQVTGQVEERLRVRRDRLPHPGSLGHNPDLQATPVDVRGADAEQLRGAGTAGHVEQKQGPIAVIAHRAEQLVPHRVRNRSWLLIHHLLAVTTPPELRNRLHRTAMRQRPATLRRRRDRVDRRSPAVMRMELVEAAQHRQLVVHRRGRVPRPQRLLAGPHVHRARRCRICRPTPPLRVARRAHPSDQHRHLGLGGPIPGQLKMPEQTPPAQQVVTVALAGQRTLVAQGQTARSRGLTGDLTWTCRIRGRQNPSAHEPALPIGDQLDIPK